MAISVSPMEKAAIDCALVQFAVEHVSQCCDCSSDVEGKRSVAAAHRYLAHVFDAAVPKTQLPDPKFYPVNPKRKAVRRALADKSH